MTGHPFVLRAVSTAEDMLPQLHLTTLKVVNGRCNALYMQANQNICQQEQESTSRKTGTCVAEAA